MLLETNVLGEVHFAKWLKRRDTSLGVLGSNHGTASYLAMRCRPLSKAVKHTSVAGPNRNPYIYYLISDRTGIRP